MGEERISYITRGAMLKCKYGTHSRRLNLPEDHGFVIDNGSEEYKHPFIIESDCVPEKNIRYFGICNCDTPPDSEKVYLVGQNNEGRLSGKKCMPKIKNEKWNQTKDDVYINGSKVFTEDSYLICEHGFCKITIETNGWEYTGEQDEGTIEKG